MGREGRVGLGFLEWVCTFSLFTRDNTSVGSSITAIQALKVFSLNSTGSEVVLGMFLWRDGERLCR